SQLADADRLAGPAVAVLVETASTSTGTSEAVPARRTKFIGSKLTRLSPNPGPHEPDDPDSPKDRPAKAQFLNAFAHPRNCTIGQPGGACEWPLTPDICWRILAYRHP